MYILILYHLNFVTKQIVTFSLNWTTQENQISSRQFLIPDITCINLILKHLNILLNLPNVKSCIIKITPTQNSFVKNILYFILSTDKAP